MIRILGYCSLVLSNAFLALASLALALAALGCAEPEAPQEPVIRPVRYEEVVSTGGRRERTFSGIARAGVESRLGFRVGGIVESVSVVVGDQVRKGQEIARLEGTDLRLQVQEAEASLTQATASLRKAEADYDRIRGLYENNNAAKSDLDGARAQAESTRAQVEAMRKRLELARRQLSYTRLLAPVDGAIASVNAEANENVRAGDAVALLASGSRPEVEVSMPDVLITQLHEGDSVEVTFDALEGVVLPAVVTEVGVAATGTGATFPVRVQLSQSDSSVRSGMSANVTFRFEAASGGERVFLPPVAVGEDREGRFVYVLQTETGSQPTADSGPGGGNTEPLATTARRSVTVGDLTPDGLEISDGLEDGELVVTAGVRRIQAGQTVKLLSSFGG